MRWRRYVGRHRREERPEQSVWLAVSPEVIATPPGLNWGTFFVSDGSQGTEPGKWYLMDGQRHLTLLPDQ